MILNAIIRIYYDLINNSGCLHVLNGLLSLFARTKHITRLYRITHKSYLHKEWTGGEVRERKYEREFWWKLTTQIATSSRSQKEEKHTWTVKRKADLVISGWIRRMFSSFCWLVCLWCCFLYQNLRNLPLGRASDLPHQAFWLSPAIELCEKKHWMPVVILWSKYNSYFESEGLHFDVWDHQCLVGVLHFSVSWTECNLLPSSVFEPGWPEIESHPTNFI